VRANPRARGPTYMRGGPEYAPPIKCAGRGGPTRIATPSHKGFPYPHLLNNYLFNYLNFSSLTLPSKSCEQGYSNAFVRGRVYQCGGRDSPLR